MGPAAIWKHGGLVQNRLLLAAVAALIAAGVGACSSPPAAIPKGALPAGTAEVTINHATLPTTTAVKCLPVGSLMMISAGYPKAGVTAQVSNETSLNAKSVAINNLGGFTGSYVAGLDGNAADVRMADQTYIIRGTADGFDTDKPSTRTTGTFAIRIAC
jgi:lipoprotein LpqH